MNDREDGEAQPSRRPRAAVPPWLALPRGSRDLLPAACRRRRALTQRLLSTFEAWGYEPVATPAIEYFDVMTHGLSEADRRGCVRFIAAGSGELVTLRADVTPQVARMLSQRWGGELPADVVHRVSYAAEVLRQPTELREQTEVHQVGIEMIGDDDPAADAELVALVDEALRAAGLARFRIDLAHTQVARGLLDSLSLPEPVHADARAQLARKDRDGLARTLAPHDAPAAVVGAVVALCDLFGRPVDVLPRARAVLRGTGVEGALAQLEAVLEHLPGLTGGDSPRITIDLGEARGFDYYTGLRVRGWAPGVRHPVARGGRYDGLPRRFGVPRPATGFAVDLDALETALFEQGVTLPEAEPTAAHLVAIAPAPIDAATRILARDEALAARAQGRRAWVQPNVTLERAQQLAWASGAERLTFVDEQGPARFSRGPQGWVPSQETP